MSIPTGFNTPDGFVCWTCRDADMIQNGPGVRLDARMASGEKCIRCKELEGVIEKAAAAMEHGGVGDGAFSSSDDCALYLRHLAKHLDDPDDTVGAVLDESWD